MLKPMFGHRPKPKKFDIPLRYYDPKEDEKRKRRIRIERNRKRPRQGLKVVMYALGLAFVVWLMSIL
ncbi:MAG: hypothetical protein WD035_02680 [Balneolaceae bacterium]